MIVDQIQVFQAGERMKAECQVQNCLFLAVLIVSDYAFVAYDDH